MPELHFAVPGDLSQRTGGYLYDRRLAQELSKLGWHVRMLRLPEGFPDPSPSALIESDHLIAGVPDGALILVDGLAYGVMPGIVERHARRLTLVALVHHPLGFETGLAPERATQLVECERHALGHARRVLVTSKTTLRTMVETFGLPAVRVAAALPGTDPAPVARGSHSATPALLAVGSILPRKDFRALVAALAPWRALPWRLTIAGSTERDPAEARRLHDAIAQHGLSDRVLLAGEVDEDAMDGLLDHADLFVSSSRYEGFGMALAEATARGLPVVAVAGGAVADWMDPEASLLVPPEQPAALSEALGRTLADPVLVARMRGAALAARDRLPTWADCGRDADLLLRSAIAS